MVDLAAEALVQAQQRGALQSLLQRINPDLARDVLVQLLGSTSKDSAKAIATHPEVDAAFKCLAPYLADGISKWSAEERAPLYVCPAGLNPDMVGGNKTERIENFSALLDAMRDRYKPLTNEKQRKFVDQFKFKVLPLSRKSFRRYWDVFKCIPWKSSAGEWCQFKKHLKEFNFVPGDNSWDDMVDAGAHATEDLWKELLGPVAYAEEFEADEGDENDHDANDKQDDPDTNNGFKQGSLYASECIHEIQADDWSKHLANIEKGEEVATLETASAHTKIRHGCTTGWVSSCLLSSIAPVVQRYISSPGGPAILHDDRYNKLPDKLPHGMAVALIVQRNDWSRIRAEGTMLNEVWVSSSVLSDKKPPPLDNTRSAGRDNGEYTLDQLMSETWPKFSTHGDRVTIVTGGGETLKNPLRRQRRQRFAKYEVGIRPFQ